MSKAYFIGKMNIFWKILPRIIIIFLATDVAAFPVVATGEKKPIIITSKTLMADNKTNTAVFEGSVVAKTDDIIIYSDKMTVFYNNSQGKVTKIYASGNVKVHKKERAIFSEEATYLNDEEKIIFTGEPKAVEGENVITGVQIIYFLKDDRSVVEGSKVILTNKKQTER
ncbi:MAG: lipopolysaccharide transport periplasmic protein LptA [Nitrospirae bacterium]|nr:lipopolysaccharide transport periplasmic protein LptA [Nitrospirota bacterium]